MPIKLDVELQALRRLLQGEGFDAFDFVVEEGDAAIFSGLGFVGALRMVKRISTDRQRIYSVDRSRRWLKMVVNDLRDGHFSEAAGASEAQHDAPAARRLIASLQSA